MTLSTALILQVAMLAAAVGLTQMPWYHVARGRGARVVRTAHYGYLANALQPVEARLALQNWLLLFGAVLAMQFWRRVAQDEDQMLLKHCGDEFRACRCKTPNFFPFTGA